MSSSSDPAQRLAQVAALTAHIAQTAGLDCRLRTALEELDKRLGYSHTMLLVPEAEERLIMLACRGYPSGGVGAELRLGEGAIGVAAARRIPVHIANVTRGLNMVRAAQARPEGSAPAKIPFPGLVSVMSQVAVPAVVDDTLVAVLYAEDTRVGWFSEPDVQCLQIIASQLAIHVLHAADDEAALGRAEVPISRGPSELVVRYYEADSSVFFGDEYVIKSLPGRILRKLLREHLSDGRTEFSKKELRLDPELKLPAVRDNLDTRLILLRRRLEERFPFARIEATGRGRFKLTVQAGIQLEEHA